MASRFAGATFAGKFAATKVRKIQSAVKVCLGLPAKSRDWPRIGGLLTVRL